MAVVHICWVHNSQDELFKLRLNPPPRIGRVEPEEPSPETQKPDGNRSPTEVLGVHG